MSHTGSLRGVDLLPRGCTIVQNLKFHAKQWAAEAQQLVTKSFCMVAWFRGIRWCAHAISRASQAADV